MMKKNNLFITALVLAVTAVCPLQTSAEVGGTIPDREYTMTAIPEREDEDGIFPIDRTPKITVETVDSVTGERIGGVKLWLVETETPQSNTVKRDFGTFITAENPLEFTDISYTLEKPSSMFSLTAVIEEVPDGYTFRGGKQGVIDYIVDSGERHRQGIEIAWTECVFRIPLDPDGYQQPVYTQTTATDTKNNSTNTTLAIHTGTTRPYIPTSSETLGDADENGKIGINDCVLIMQSIAKPDSYEISEQGKLNADVCNRGDGVTIQDAMVIQMIESRTLSASDLPVEM